MNELEVSARMTIRNGEVEGFKQCAVREVYEGSQGLIEYRKHVGEAINKRFLEFAEHHAAAIYGNPSLELVAFVKGHKDVESKWYSPLGGLEPG